MGPEKRRLAQTQSWTVETSSFIVSVCDFEESSGWPIVSACGLALPMRHDKHQAYCLT